METITRKVMLYRSGVEYGDYTMNHVQGCAHGCRFPCYAFLMKKRFGLVQNYSDWLKPKLVANTLELLDKEIPRLKDKIHSVQLCFSTDPFMVGFPEIEAMSLAAIKKLNQAGIKCITLTKGLLPLELSAMSKENEHGITLISLNENFREVMEPGTAPYEQRISALRALHEAGCKTWVSIEPYPTPNLIRQELRDILNSICFVDRIVFGRTNYSKKANSYAFHKEFYNEMALQVIDFCNEHAIQYYIKKKTMLNDLSEIKLIRD